MHDQNKARVQIVAEGQEVTLDVIVFKDDAPAILLGKDHPKTRALLVDKKADPVPNLVRAITRAQDKVQQKERVVDSIAGARDGALPKPGLHLQTCQVTRLGRVWPAFLATDPPTRIKDLMTRILPVSYIW